MDVIGGQVKRLIVNSHPARGRCSQQAGNGHIVDRAWDASGKIMNQILDRLIEDLGISAVLYDLMVDIPPRLLFG